METAQLLHLNENSNLSDPSSDSGLVKDASDQDGSCRSAEDDPKSSQSGGSSNRLVKPKVESRPWLPAAYIEAVSDDKDSPDKHSSKQDRAESSVVTPRKDPTWQPDEGETASDESDDSPVKDVKKKPRQNTPRPSPANGSVAIASANFYSGVGSTQTPVGASSDVGTFRRPEPYGKGNPKKLKLVSPSKSDVEKGHSRTPVGTSSNVGAFRQPEPYGKGNPKKLKLKSPSKKEKSHSRTPAASTSKDGVFKQPTSCGGGSRNSGPKTPKKLRKTKLDLCEPRTKPGKGETEKDSLVISIKLEDIILTPIRPSTSAMVRDDATRLKDIDNTLNFIRQRFREVNNEYEPLRQQAKKYKCKYIHLNKSSRRGKSGCTAPLCLKRKAMKKELSRLIEKFQILKQKKKPIIAGILRGQKNTASTSSGTPGGSDPQKEDGNMKGVEEKQSTELANIQSTKLANLNANPQVQLANVDVTALGRTSGLENSLPTPNPALPVKGKRGRPMKTGRMEPHVSPAASAFVRESCKPLNEGGNFASASPIAGVGDEVEDVIITSDILNEEEKLAKKNELEAAKHEKALSEKARLKREREKSDEEIREQSKKRLMNLLEKSKFYADFMRKTLEHHKQKKRGRKPNPTVSQDAPDTKVDTKDSSSKRKRKLCAKYSEEMFGTVQLKKKKKGEKEALKDVSHEVNTISSSGSLVSGNSKESVVGVPEKPGTRLTPLGIEVHEDQPLLLEGAALREYQIEGFNWLRDLFEKGMNGILADEMGLGKTIQTISLICHLYAHGIHGPFLIVAPLSTLPNWVHEFQTFAPKLPVVLYHGNEVKRKSLARKLRKESELLGKKVLPVVVTSYEVPTRDYKVLGDITWKFIIVDEGHRIKNYKTALARTLSGMRSINRLLLTGTPLQNDLTELWSLLHFILPEVFDNLDVFETLFTAEELSQNGTADVCLEKESKGNILSLLHEVLTPFLLRRLKSDVDLKIPPKKEILVHCPMTRIQLDLYKAVLDETIMLFDRDAQRRVSFLEVHMKKKKRYSKLRDPSECESAFEPEELEESEVVVFGNKDFQYKLKVKMTMPHIELIKILNHPYLIHPKVLPGSCYLHVDEEIIECSGKMTMLDGLLERLKARGHRVLIFSTYTQLLDLIEDYAGMKEYEYRRLDGNTNIDDRREAMKDFNTNPDIFLFLLSTRAGGLGINLTGADTVIIFNSDWNPQADLQAQDRCHRIGQTKPVVIYRFITPGTFDERIINRAESKRKLEKMILQKGKFKHGSAGKEDVALSLQELKTLFNERQHNLEIQPNGTTLTDQQWEALLDRSELVGKCK